MKKLSYILTITLSMVMTSCFGSKGVSSSSKDVTVQLTSTAVPTEHYSNLNHGLNLGVVSDVESYQIVDDSELPPKYRKIFSKFNYKFTPSVKTFVEESMSSYIRRMGIQLNSDIQSDYKLRITVNTFKVVRQESDARTTVVLNYTLSNNNNERIFSKVATGRYISNGEMAIALDKATSLAFQDMDWQAITDALTVHKRPDQERQRKVTGEGDTSLEHTVIRWFIDSTPKGADVSWRVVSSTPDVKNTNSTYVGTTPYETTETFDIRGLNFENAGNVQIEVTCERAGYLTQKRRFNLRQAIEQKEISAKFNLIKDE